MRQAGSAAGREKFRGESAPPRCVEAVMGLLATKQDDGSVIIRAGRAWVQFDAADLQQLYAYAADRPTIQRYPVTAPKSPQTDE